MAHNLGKALSGLKRPGFAGAKKQIMAKSGVSAKSAGDRK